MKAPLTLSDSERHFYTLVAEAAFTNPFSQEREVIDKKITRLTKAKSRTDRIQVVCAKLAENIKKLEEKKAASIQKYAPPDSDLLKYAFLFEAYHAFIGDYDALIKKQIEEPGALSKATFAPKLLNKLNHRGISKAEAVQYLSIFYQLRRAYFFIDQALIGDAPSMKELKKHLWNNVFTSDIRWYEHYFNTRMEDFSTFLLGETGTGKGTAAAAIGRCGYIPYNTSKQCFAHNFTESFVSINLSQFQESLIESELFGHTKGAFTGAIENHKGLFSRCSAHGSVFLDEIGDVSVPIQIKLLNVIQDRTFSPVGSHDLQRFNGRVIAATNQPIDKLRERGKFRDDLYYRLCSDIIHVPSLSQRVQEDPKELKRLLSHISNRITGQNSPELADELHQIISESVDKHYSWPGNVRELEQAVRRVLISKRYKPEASPSKPTDLTESIQSGINNGKLTAGALLSMYSKLLYERLGTYESVAHALQLDRRTAKKYITE